MSLESKNVKTIDYITNTDIKFQKTDNIILVRTDFLNEYRFYITLKS